MSSSILSNTASKTNVGMGQISLGQAPTRLGSVLGSCVGVAIFHPRKPIGVLAHVVLPDSVGHQGLPGKFADTAIPLMISELQAAGAQQNGLVAKITGGACMFGGKGPMQIGKANIEAVESVLAVAGIPILARDVGGDKGRRIELDCENGDLRVEVVGKPARIL